MGIRRNSLALLFLVFVVAAARRAQDPQSPIDSTQGKKIYNNQCALCHGVGGGGGRGPSLTRPKLPRASTREALIRLIQEGVPGSEMSASWMLNEKEVELVASYVLSLGRLEPEKLSGNPSKGKTVYEAKGSCANCHIVAGQGGVAGPELTDIGARRSAAYLRTALLDPSADVPEGFLVVTLTTKDGKRIRGVRLNEDPFSIQLRDSGNRFQSFRKAELQDIKKELGVSTMPGYKDAFTAEEFEDLIAYLASLRGEK